DDPIQEGLILRRLLSEQQYLKESVRLLRRFAKGYTAADGFDLHKLDLIPQAKINRVKHYAAILREETSQQTVDAKGRVTQHFKVVRPRSAHGHRALEAFTGQTIIPNRRGYVVPLSEPQKQSVGLVTKTVTLKDKLGRPYKAKQTQVEVTTQRGRMTVYNRYFRFPETPITFDDVILMTRKMLRFMPRGWYVIETSTHGAISAPIRKDDLLGELANRFLVYDVLPGGGGKDSRGLAETVVGYRLIGMTADDAHREFDARLTRRDLARLFREQQRAARRRRLRKRLAGVF
ncbi:MAG: hypothetical protein ACRD4G_17005, partial [Bryobacteraceae bacterium]